MHLPLPGQIPTTTTFFSLLPLATSAWKSLFRVYLCPNPRGQKWPLTRALLLCCAVEREGHCKLCWHIWGALTAGPGVHLQRPSCSDSQVCHEGTVTGEPCVSSGELVSGCDTPSHPGSQEDVSSDWHSAHTRWQMQFLGPGWQRALAFYHSASRSVKVS